MVLEAENAIAKWRDLMGATNPANAAEGTIRKRFAENIERNCVHGSDAPETAAAGNSLLLRELRVALAATIRPEKSEAAKRTVRSSDEWC